MATWLMPVCRSWRLPRQRPAPPRTPPPTRAGSGGRPSCRSPRGGSTPVEIAQAGNRQLTGAVLARGAAADHNHVVVRVHRGSLFRATGQGIDADNHGSAARRLTQEKSLVRIDWPRAAPSGPEPPCRRPRRPGTGPGSSTGAEHSARRPGWVASQPPAERQPRGTSHTERPTRRAFVPQSSPPAGRAAFSARLRRRHGCRHRSLAERRIPGPAALPASHVQTTRLKEST
jgi:hypothetical protein